jgi:putative hydrolase of the HAD superfamily
MTGKRAIRGIFFDIDDTLYSTTEFARKARANALRAMIQAGLKVDFSDALKELHEVINEFSSNYSFHLDKLLGRFPADCVGNVNPAIVVASGVVQYHQTKFAELHPFPDVLEVLKILARTDLVRGIITAGLTIKQAEKIVRLKVYDYLTPDAIFISDQVGISKPNIKLFLRACSSCGLAPEETMYVGDDPRNDIDPCNKIGIVTVKNRRAGRHRDAAGETEPDYEIDNFWDLLNILREDFALEA